MIPLDSLTIGYLIFDDPLPWKYKILGTLSWEWKSSGIPLPQNRKVTNNPFRVFDRYEIHIQAFVHFINGKVIISNPHLHKIIFKICIQIPTNKKRTKTNKNEQKKHGTYDMHVSFFSQKWVPHWQKLYFSKMIP